MEINISMPNKDTDLFKMVEGGYHIACIHQLDFETYCIGYLDACKLILNDMGKNRQFISDTLVFPIVYLFRHYLELRLKKIIIIGKKNSNKRVNVIKYKHNLENLWKEAKECIKTYWPSSCNSELNIIKNNILEFHNKFDQFASAFRYPVDNRGNKSFKKNVHIDLKQFKKSMEEISNFLDGCSEGMLEEKEITLEMKREFANELIDDFIA